MRGTPEDCLRWLKEEKGINFHDRFGIVEAIMTWCELNK